MFSNECICMVNVIVSIDVFVIIFIVEDYERLIRIFLNIVLKYKFFFEVIYKYYKRKDDKFFFVDFIKYFVFIVYNEMKSSLVEFVKEYIKLIIKFLFVVIGIMGFFFY